MAVIYRPYRTLPDGRKLWARTYGFKAWRIEIDDEEVVDTDDFPIIKIKRRPSKERRRRRE